MQRNIAAEETVKAVVPPVTTARSSTPFAASPLEVGAVGEYAGTYVHVLRAERPLDDGVCGEVG